MKRTIFISAVLLLILGLGIFSLVWLGNYTETLSGELNRVAETAGEDPKKALEELLALQEDWHKAEHKIGLFVHEEMLQKASDEIEASVACLRQGLDGDFQVQIRKAIFTIKNIYHQEFPSLENIF